MTADTYSSTLGYLVMGTGNDNNTWGGNANTAVFQIFEDAIANALTSSVTGGTLDLSGSPPPAAASQARYAALIFNGTLGSNQVVQVPNLQKFWFGKNATAGAFTLKLKTPTGTASTAIPQNSGWQVIYCDGANGIVVDPFNSNTIQMPDGTISAPAYSNINEPSSGWRRHATEDWRLTILGVDVLQVTGAGAATPNVINAMGASQVVQQNGNSVPQVSGTPVAGHFALFTGPNTIADVGANSITQALLAPGAAPLPYVGVQVTDNLHIVNDGTNATRDLNYTPGRVRDDADLTNLQLVATMYKRLDTAWAAGGAAGAPAGACDTGVKGNTQTWHSYLIGKLALAPTTYARSGTTVTLVFGSAHGLGVGGTIRVIGIGAGFDGLYVITGVTTNNITYTSTVSGTVVTVAVPTNTTVDGFDILASQSYPTPTMPSGWTVKQCLGSSLTDSSANIMPVVQVGDEFIHGTMQFNSSLTAFSVARALIDLRVPLGVKVRARFRAQLSIVGGSSPYYMLFTSPDETDQACGGGASANVSQSSSTPAPTATNELEIRTNTLGQVGARSAASTAGNSYNVAAFAWRDPRRRMF